MRGAGSEDTQPPMGNAAFDSLASVHNWSKDFRFLNLKYYKHWQKLPDKKRLIQSCRNKPYQIPLGVLPWKKTPIMGYRGWQISKISNWRRCFWTRRPQSSFWGQGQPYHPAHPAQEWATQTPHMSHSWVTLLVTPDRIFTHIPAGTCGANHWYPLAGDRLQSRTWWARWTSLGADETPLMMLAVHGATEELPARGLWFESERSSAGILSNKQVLTMLRAKEKEEKLMQL